MKMVQPAISLENWNFRADLLFIRLKRNFEIDPYLNVKKRLSHARPASGLSEQEAMGPTPRREAGLERTPEQYASLRLRLLHRAGRARHKEEINIHIPPSRGL